MGRPPTFPDKIAALGYCCIFWFIKQNSRSRQAGRDFNLNDRTIRRWKKKVREGKCKCAATSECQVAAQRAEA